MDLFYTPADETTVPTGEIRSVKGTPMDFTVAKKIGKILTRMMNSCGLVPVMTTTGCFGIAQEPWAWLQLHMILNRDG